MRLPPFKLEQFYIDWEFTAKYQLSSSDAESWSVKELLEMATAEERGWWENFALGYTQTQGDPRLLEAIGQTYEKDPKILTFAGAEEGILHTMAALLEKEDHAVVITPCYQSLMALPQKFGEATAVPLGENWQLDLKRVEAAIQKNTKLIVINFPHNPTGALLSHKELEQLVAIARKNGCYLFSDEVYRFLEINEADRLPQVVDIYEKGISLGVLSKAYGLPGLRIGWIATQDKTLFDAVFNQKCFGTICNSAPSEILAIIALRNREKIIARNRKILLSNFAKIEAFFTKYSKLFSYVPTKGGCIGFPKWLLGDVEPFTLKLVQEKGVVLVPGPIYDDLGDHFRIGFGRRNLPECLAVLEEYVKDL